MSAPDVPDLPVTRRGDHPNWWSVHDQAILDGELAKLQNLPRPAYVADAAAQRDAGFKAAAADTANRIPPYRPIVAPPRPRRVARIGLVITIVGLIALAWLMIWAAAAPPDDPGPTVTVTPATYGPSGPSGGVWVAV